MYLAGEATTNMTNKLLLTIFLYSFFWQSIAVGQEPVPESAETNKGIVFGRIFANFHTSLAGDNNQTLFEVRRAYLGYKRNLSPALSSEVKMDIGSPDDISGFSLLRRYGYIKTAAVFYEFNKWSFGFGIQDAIQFKVQEKFWGRRYLYKSFMDEYKFGSSSDLGFTASWSSGIATIDGALFNEEGYSDLQENNTFKSALGVTLIPGKHFITRLYGDLMPRDTIQTKVAVFAGYAHHQFSVGSEYNYLINKDFNKDHNQFGWSVYADINIKKRIKLFGRFDKLESNKLMGNATLWNLSKDGSALISGIEFLPLDNVKVATNYQGWYPADTNSSNNSSLYLNLEVSF